MEPSLSTSTGSVGPHDGEGPGNPGSLLLSLILHFFLLCNPRFSFAYKRGSRAPHERGRPGGIWTQEHDTSTWLSGKRALGTRSLLPPETWDPLPLSSVCNPYCKPSVGNTSSGKLDIGTFHLNQYKPLCPPSTPPSPTRKYKFTRRWSKNTDILVQAGALRLVSEMICGRTTQNNIFSEALVLH